MAHYVPKDRFFHRAKQEGFAARSVYKLAEIDRRFQILFDGAIVLDLGCSPGSWLQYAEPAVGPTGWVLGFDLVPPRVSLGPRARFHEADVLTLNTEAVRKHLADLIAFRGAKTITPYVDAVLSDMAPKTTGIRDADQAGAATLIEHAMALSLALLKPLGCFVFKTFVGQGFEEALQAARLNFGDVHVTKPEATRRSSREAFVIARGIRRKRAGI